MPSPEFYSINNHYSPETGFSPTESVSKRDHAVASFRRAVELMRFDNSETSDLRLLTHEEELDMMLLEETARKIRFGRGDNTAIRQWHDKKTGEQYTIDEGVPIEGLLAWLRRRKTAHGSNLSEEDLQRILEASELYETLSDYSIPFQDCHDEMPWKTYRDMRVARIRLEEELIDPCLPGLNRMKRRELAHKRINNRLEFRPPVDYNLGDYTRRTATALFLTDDEHNGAPKEKTRARRLLSKVPTESVVFVAAATALNTILQDQGMDPEVVIAATTATVSGVSAATSYKRLKGQDETTISKTKQTLRNSLISGGATLAAGSTTPEVLIQTLDAMPPQIEGAVKATIPTITGIAGYASRKQLKAYLEKLFERSKQKNGNAEQPPQPEYDLTKQSQLATYESISILMNHYARMSNMTKRFGSKVTKQWNIEGAAFEETAKQLMLVSVVQKGTEAQRAFVRYKALSDFVRYRKLFIDNHEKKTDNKQRKTPALDAIRDIDHLALSSFDSLHELLENDDELRAFSYNYERGLGLAYLLSLRRSWKDNEPRSMRFDAQVKDIEDSVYGETKEELERKVDETYHQMLRVVRFKPVRKIVKKIKQGRHDDAAEDIVDVVKDTSKKVLRV